MTKDRDYGSASWVPWNAISICNDQRARRVSDSRPGCPSRMNKPLWRATKLRGAPRMHKPAIEWNPFSSLPDSSSSIYKNTTSTLHIYICKLPMYSTGLWQTLGSKTASHAVASQCVIGSQGSLLMVSNYSWRKLAWRQMYYVCLVLTKLYKASKSAQMSSLDLSVILNLHIEVSREYVCVFLIL